jgi:transposase InsO family protein
MAPGWGILVATRWGIQITISKIEHRTTQVRRPQSNGIVERLHRTLLDEHFRIVGRTKFYENLDEMQIDLDGYLLIYNRERAHQGRNMNGRTPYQAFIEGLINDKKEDEQAVG